MEMAVMRFASVDLPHNPKTLKIEHRQSIASTDLLGGETVVRGVSAELLTIRGTGELYGRSCFEQYNKLKNLCFQKKADVLSLPDIGAVKAVLCSLDLSAAPKDGLLTVDFEFRQVNDTQTAEKITVPLYHITESGECLWDIAYIHQVDIESLVELNPWLRNVWSIEQGREVRLR